MGKNGQVKSIIVEPDGNGVIARINIKWSGVVIAIEYGATVRWRFTATDHLNSDVEKAIGFGIVTDKSKRELDDYLRTKIYPLVQAEAAK